MTTILQLCGIRDAGGSMTRCGRLRRTSTNPRPKHERDEDNIKATIIFQKVVKSQKPSYIHPSRAQIHL